MNVDVTCLFCEYEFKAIFWSSGECPNCKEQYKWSEEWDEEDGEVGVLEWRSESR